MPKPIRVCRGVRPLYADGEGLYCSKGSKILLTEDAGASFKEVASMRFAGRLAPFAITPLAARVLRTQPYRMVPAGPDAFVFQSKPGTYRVPSETGKAKGESQTIFGAVGGSRPTSLARRTNGDIVFGDYIPNFDRAQAINIYGSSDSGLTWTTRYTFPPGVVRHIHGIAYDPWLDCYWIATGDYPDESALWKAAADFSSVEPVVRGSTNSRFYSIAVTEKALIMATDSPSVQNYICVYDKVSGAFTQACEIQNSSFYHGFCGERLFVSTNCEFPDPHAEVTQENDRVRSHLWSAKPPYTDWKEVLSFDTSTEFAIYRKPRTYQIFQYPRIFMPDGRSSAKYLFLYTVGLRPHPDSLLVYDADDL